MIRLVVTVCDAGRAANVGGPVLVNARTFDIEHDELEKLLQGVPGSYTDAHISGAEVLPKSAKEPHVG